MKFNDFWKAFFKSDNKEVVVKSNRIKKSDIEIYRNRAKEYVLTIIQSDEKNNVTIQENLTLEVTEHIYINIILKELFNVESPSKERGNDDFSSSLEKIRNEIIELVSNPCEYDSSFLNDIIEEYPIFGKLELDEKNKLVFDDIKMVKEFIEISKRVPLPKLNFEFNKILSIKDEISIRNGKLASYINELYMEAVDFELLTSIIIDLYAYSEAYQEVFSEKEIEKLANTAVKAYNHFYGKSHVVYRGKANNNHWGMHQYLIEYLFMIQLIILSIQIIHYSDEKN